MDRDIKYDVLHSPLRSRSEKKSPKICQKRCNRLTLSLKKKNTCSESKKDHSPAIATLFDTDEKIENGITSSKNCKSHVLRNIHINQDTPETDMAPRKVKKVNNKPNVAKVEKLQSSQRNNILSYFSNNNKNSKTLESKTSVINTKNKEMPERKCDVSDIIDLCNSDDSLEKSFEKALTKSNISINSNASAISKMSVEYTTSKISTLTDKSVTSSLFGSRKQSMLNMNVKSPFRQKKKDKPYPPYKVVEGTPFAVDAFCYGDIAEASVYFLTHFHSDHYIGLKKSFNKPLYCTKITGDLCQQKLYVSPSCISILELDKPVVIQGVTVTAIDANHCPGSIMLVFELPCGKNILHCGDFRATDLMESQPIFWNKQIHTIYLDTTYCNPRYNFPTQGESIDLALGVIETKKQAMINAGNDPNKLLIICGTYTIGKENFFLGIADSLKIDIWADAEKSKILRTALGKDFNKNSPHKCHLHVLPMMKLNYNYLDGYLRNAFLGDSFTEILSFKGRSYKHPLVQCRTKFTEI